MSNFNLSDFQSGMRVSCISHGLGTVINVRKSKHEKESFVDKKEMEYFLKESHSPVASVLCGMLIENFYSEDKYPLEIQFDDGYKDVYSLEDIDFIVKQ